MNVFEIIENKVLLFEVESANNNFSLKGFHLNVIEYLTREYEGVGYRLFLNDKEMPESIVAILNLHDDTCEQKIPIMLNGVAKIMYEFDINEKNVLLFEVVGEHKEQMIQELEMNVKKYLNENYKVVNYKIFTKEDSKSVSVVALERDLVFSK